MSSDVKGPRRYDASGRREQANRNRRAVLDSAHRLFLENGFAGTTVPMVANDAGVSVQTVYKVFGNKVGLAKAVFDVAMAGDDEPGPMLDRSMLRRVRDEPDPRRKFALYGEFLAVVAPRHVPVQLVIREAAGHDPDAQTAWNTLQEERRAGMTNFADALAAAGSLRSDVSAADARDVLWTYNSAEVYQLLVMECRWSPERYGEWVAAALTAALLPAPPGRGGRPSAGDPEAVDRGHHRPQ
jgi:AcrR family transcriptional regulator